MITRRFLAQHPNARFMLCNSRNPKPLTNKGAGYTAEEMYERGFLEVSYLTDGYWQRRVTRVGKEWWLFDGSEVVLRIWIAVMPDAQPLD